jgi:N-acylmannosamine kinase
VESVASGTAIARAAAEAGHPGLDAAAVAACGEAWAAAILDRSAAAVAALCADLAALLGLDRIALGGGVGLAEGYRARVERWLAAEPPLFRPVLVAPALGADSALAGALAVAADGA